jgi:hypothetical protein
LVAQPGERARLGVAVHSFEFANLHAPFLAFQSIPSDISIPQSGSISPVFRAAAPPPVRSFAESQCDFPFPPQGRDYVPSVAASRTSHFGYDQFASHFLAVSDSLGLEFDSATEADIFTPPPPDIFSALAAVPRPVLAVSPVEEHFCETELFAVGHNSYDELLKRRIAEITQLKKDCASRDVKLRCLQQEFDSFRQFAQDCISKHCKQERSLQDECTALQVLNTNMRRLIESSGNSSEEKISDIYHRQAILPERRFVTEELFEVIPAVMTHPAETEPAPASVYGSAHGHRHHDARFLLVSDAASIAQVQTRTALRSSGKITHVSTLPDPGFVPLAISPISLVIERRAQKLSLSFDFRHYRISPPRQPPVLHLELQPTIAHFRPGRTVSRQADKTPLRRVVTPEVTVSRSFDFAIEPRDD